MNHKAFWILRHQVSKIAFWMQKVWYSITKKYDNGKKAISFQSLIIRTTVWQTLKSLVFAGILFIGDKWLLPFIYTHILRCDTVTMNQTIAVDIFLGGLGIAGVILGLYCSNIVSIFSAKYANAPNRLSQLFQRDIITNRCVRQIISYIVFCIILLGECVVGIDISYISTLVFLLMTVYTIIMFSIVGNRTNQLSNTYYLSQNLYPEMIIAMKRVSGSGFYSQNPSFQYHFQKVCFRGLNDLLAISQFNADNPANQNAATLSFMSDTLLLMELYWQEKGHIRYDSLWYKDKVNYPQWHYASDTEIEIALKTGTTLNTKTARDYRWFEDNIEKVNRIGFEKLCKDGDADRVLGYINHIINLSTHALECGDILSWVHTLERLQSVYKSSYIQTSNENSDEMTAAVFDSFVGAYISIIVAINSYLRSMNIPSLLDQATKLQFPNKAAITSNPLINNQYMDNLFHKIAIELRLERRRLTPDWYIKQIAAKAVVSFLNDMSETIVVLSDNIMATGKDLLKGKKFFPAGVVFAHSLEFEHKSEVAVSLIEQHWSTIEEFHIEPTILWDESNVENAKHCLKNMHKEIPQHLAKCSSIFSVSHWENRNDYPDLLGLCYNHICESLVEAIENDDFETFKSLYSGFLTTMLLYDEYIRTDVIKTKEPHLQRATLHVATAPIVEYAMISGFAILWGEFSKKPCWKELVQNELTGFVKQMPDGVAKLQYISQMAEARQHLFFGIGNRDILQTGWKIRIANAIRSSELYEIEYGPFGQQIIKTESKLFKTFCGSNFADLGFTNEVEDIYFICCVNQYIEEKYQSDGKWEEQLYEE